jgi:hypothetical protein
MPLEGIPATVKFGDGGSIIQSVPDMPMGDAASAFASHAAQLKPGLYVFQLDGQAPQAILERVSALLKPYGEKHGVEFLVVPAGITITRITEDLVSSK